MAIEDSPALDTPPAIYERQMACLRRLRAEEKWALVEQLREAALTFAAAGIRARYPGASERECLLRLRELTLGRELACKVYPELARLP